MAALQQLRLHIPDVNVKVAAGVQEGVASAQDGDPDVIIFRPSPGTPAREGVAELRLHSDAPVVLVAQPREELDLETALETGADDYLGDPLRTTELAARVAALVRRVRIDRTDETTIVRGPLVIKRPANQVSLYGRALNLDRTEFELLVMLAVSEGPVSETILSHLVGEYDDVPLNEHIDHLSSKLTGEPIGHAWIVQVGALGHKLTGPAP